MAIAGLVLLILGICFVIYYPIFKKKNKRCTALTQGRLIEKYEKGLGGETTTTTTYHVYSYYVDGMEYRLDTNLFGPQVQNVGDVVQIWYNPRNPKDSQALHFEKGFKGILVTGIVLVIVGIVLVIL